MPYTDAHCHLQDQRLAETLPNLLARAKNVGITRFVCCGTSEADWNDVLMLAANNADVMSMQNRNNSLLDRELHELLNSNSSKSAFVSGVAIIPMLGLHPWFVGEARPGWDERLSNLLRFSLAGVGECGLDFAVSRAIPEAQISALEIQWRLAIKLNRPLSLHCRKAFDAICKLAERLGLPDRGAVIHAFSGSAEQAKIAIHHGFHLSFACSLMNPKNNRSRKAIMAVPVERLLLETDSPDIPPAPETLNEPANLIPLLNAVAELRGETPEFLNNQLECNAQKVLDTRSIMT